jgi:segregation and condensation protein B
MASHPEAIRSADDEASPSGAADTSDTRDAAARRVIEVHAALAEVRPAEASADPNPNLDPNTDAVRAGANEAPLPGPGASEPCASEPLAARIEALLLAADRPLTDARIAQLLGLKLERAAAAVRDAIADLNRQYQQTGRSFRIDKVAGGWQVLTLPTFGPILSRLHHDRQTTRLSQAALETLAIIAYRQPILRSDIETIRGVACGEVLRSLLERRLVKVVGRAEEIGRPMLYGTTRDFLKTFGMAALGDLPAVPGLGGVARRAVVETAMQADPAPAVADQPAAVPRHPADVQD